MKGRTSVVLAAALLIVGLSACSFERKKEEMAVQPTPPPAILLETAPEAIPPEASTQPAAPETAPAVPAPAP